MGEIRVGFDIKKKPIPPEVLEAIEASRVNALAEADWVGPLFNPKKTHKDIARELRSALRQRFHEQRVSVTTQSLNIIHMQMADWDQSIPKEVREFAHAFVRERDAGLVIEPDCWHEHWFAHSHYWLRP
jgi:hypothetical protein